MPVAVTPFPMQLKDFQVRYPEFKQTSTELVVAMLQDAALLIDQSVWGNLAGQGHGLLTAHRLALSPFGQQARMILDKKNPELTTYKSHYDQLVAIVGSGYRVL